MINRVLFLFSAPGFPLSYFGSFISNSSCYLVLLNLCPSFCITVCLSVCLSFGLSLCISLYLSLCISLSLSLCSIKLDIFCLSLCPCLYIAQCISLPVSPFFFFYLLVFFSLHTLSLSLSLSLFLSFSLCLCFHLYLPISFFLSLLCGSSLFSEYYFVNLVSASKSVYLFVFHSNYIHWLTIFFPNASAVMTVIPYL